jgi:ABC-type transporter lipoprotein component MlaA/pimeloyl-ACP methyl ester carboxylesterase
MKLRIRFPHLAILVYLVASTLQAQSQSVVPVQSFPATTVSLSMPKGVNTIVLPSPLSDPIEPFNRGVWDFNVGLMRSVIKPASKGYRFMVPKPIRQGIGNAGRNLTFPVRFINEGFQGDWPAIQDETKGCFLNTVIGFGGIFDVAARSNVPKHDTGFGQTFQKWGWQPGIFLMLPILGPSDVREGSGLVADAAANPLNYFVPYCYIGTGVTANNLSDTVDGAVRFSESEADSYSILQYAWTFSHENRKVDLILHGSQDPASLETLQSFFFNYKNPEFLSRAKTRSVLIPATGKKLDFTFWLQRHHAPIVYLIPGFGAHRLDGNELGLAELLVSNGYSVVTVSSTFHPEFMENASSTELPAFPPIDVKDLHVALTQIDRDLDAKYPRRLGERAIMGYSMGAFQSLFMAATEATNQVPLVKFERYIAIDSPVRLRYAVTNLDQYYQAPVAWPVAEREADIENLLLKVAAVVTQPKLQQAPLPFNAVESKFLIGLNFRLTLRDIIFSTQLRHNRGILHQKIDKFRRRAVYDEILNYSFQDYIELFAKSYDCTLGIDLNDPEVVKQGTDLRTCTTGLQDNPNIRVILNRNDLLLADADINWIERTFAPSQVTEFPDGGHVGNLSQPAVQQAILRALDGLGALPARTAKRIIKKSELLKGSTNPD